jgi:hypothetical protein
VIAKDWCGFRHRHGVQEGFESVDRLGPQRAKPFLASLTPEANERGPIRLQIGCPDIEEFLDAGARIEQCEQQRPISNVIPPECNSFQHGADFFY